MNTSSMTTDFGRSSGGMSRTRQWENRFQITNQDELSLAYRLLTVRGLPPGDHYDKNLNQLLKQVRYQMRQPVALVRRGDAPHLAIPATAALPVLEQRLVPHVARLEPSQETYPLALARLDAETTPIAVAFLEYAFRRPLWGRQDLWEDGRHCYHKQSINADDFRATMDIYSGFVWGVEIEGDGRLYLVVDTRNRYIDRLWLTERLEKDGTEPRDYFLRHCLYYFGHQWYVVQLLRPTGLSIAEQEFVVEDTREVARVLPYTRQKCGPNPPDWVRDLDPTSPAVIYRYPGNQKERYGALALCKLTCRTAEVEAANLHRRSALGPTQHTQHVVQVVRRFFQHAQLGGQPIRVATTPLEVERRVFSVPAQRFGHDRVLAVAAVAAGPEPAQPSMPVTDHVVLRDLGRRRLDLLLSAEAGPLDKTPFDAQYLLMPYSLPRSINDDFERRFVDTMRMVSGQAGYMARRIMYDDRHATSLFKQIEAIKGSLEQNGVRRGYALLVLPLQPRPQLHHHIKAQLWPDLQLQCARADKLQGFYDQFGDHGGYRVAQDRAGKFKSYLRNCALAMLVVNRKWPWSLAAPLHYEVYVGIDVLNHVAGVTFVYDQGQQIEFHDYKSKQAERLTSPQVREILVRHLREGLAGRDRRPPSLVIHRDGQAFSSERTGIRAAVRDLQQEGLLPLDVVVGIVDIRKTTAVPPRLVEGSHLEAADNPTLGSYRVHGPREGIICNTGWPFRFPGTARPLSVVVVEGDLNIEWVLEDTFALSQPVFTAPDRCERLPLTIKLADDLLEPIAAASDDDAARYDDSEEPEEDADEPLIASDSTDETGHEGIRLDMRQSGGTASLPSPVTRHGRAVASVTGETTSRRHML